MIDTIYTVILFIISIVGTVVFVLISKFFFFMKASSPYIRLLFIAGGFFTGLVALGFVLLFLILLRAVTKKD